MISFILAGMVLSIIVNIFLFYRLTDLEERVGQVEEEL